MPKSYQAGVRCCSCDGKSCQTDLRCPADHMSYDNANAECHKKGLRLCTKDELLDRVCCGTGGDCNRHLIWTSPTEPGMYGYTFRIHVSLHDNTFCIVHYLGSSIIFSVLISTFQILQKCVSKLLPALTNIMTEL